MFEGMSKDQETVTNDKGAKQSNLPYRFDLIPADVIFTLARILDEGARKYGDTNWHEIPTNDHLNHALAHIYAYLGGDEQDEHLAHALTRLVFSVFTSKNDFAPSPSSPYVSAKPIESPHVMTAGDIWTDLNIMFKPGNNHYLMVGNAEILLPSVGSDNCTCIPGNVYHVLTCPIVLEAVREAKDGS